MSKNKSTFYKRQREDIKRRKKIEKIEKRKVRKIERETKMNESECNNLSEKVVLSVDFGVGEVTGIERFDDGVSYLRVESNGGKTKSFYPAESNKGIRFLASEALASSALKMLEAESSDIPFESKKERLIFIRDCLQAEDIRTLLTSISRMLKEEDLSVIERKILKKLIDSVVLEISLVFKINSADSKKLIEDKLKGKNFTLICKQTA